MTADYFANNPFTILYETIWDHVDARLEAVTLIREGNRIRFDQLDNRDPLKENTQAADMPELMIAPVGFQGNLTSSSNSTDIIVTYSAITSTGDMRYKHYLAQMQWILLSILMDWKAKLGIAQWQGKDFIKKITLNTEAAGFFSDPGIEQVRQQGWSSVLQFDVTMIFHREDVRVHVPNLESA